MEYVVVLERTFLFYILITILYRFMGKREVGQLGIVDLIVSILIAEIVAISLDNTDDNIFLAIIPIALLVICQVVMAFLSLKKRNVREMFDGTPSVIINKGKINIKEMVKQRYNLDDLLTQLREKDYRSISEVDYAILENSGKLSIFKKSDDKDLEFPLPIILEGKINYDALEILNKDEDWLLRHIQCEVKDIFYGFYKKNKVF